ncbi:hypothetical protein [Streptomyces venezuelae]|uniref:Uncharacterized protein n=1 Tax=Streptomyces venezuelae TaxID=54571 RepID=A0A5P2BB80_STRVZ|nr:hypothetical protein [Streptomyces venezuelae]QES27307.1 hypothetical protein DEJ47_13320 [Streptomyces venezuelae]
MTQPPADALLFDMPPPPTPVERLLHLADQYSQHNDALDLLLQATNPPQPEAHAAPAQDLATATTAAIKAIQSERLYESEELTEVVVRLRQLSFLADASAGLSTEAARDLTALAPEATVASAATLAGEFRRRRGATAPVPDARLGAVHRTALAEIACGHVVASSSLGREFTRSREPKVLMSTLRALETKGLAERATGSAPAAYTGGPHLDRVRLTPTGVTALASVLGLPAAGSSPAPAATPRPLPTVAQAAARNR